MSRHKCLTSRKVHSLHHFEFNGNVTTDVPLDRWYLVCYVDNAGCRKCHVDVLCQNDLSMSCGHTSLQSSVAQVNDTSMQLWVLFGNDYPFVNRSTVEVQVARRGVRSTRQRYKADVSVSETRFTCMRASCRLDRNSIFRCSISNRITGIKSPLASFSIHLRPSVGLMALTTTHHIEYAT